MYDAKSVSHLLSIADDNSRVRAGCGYAPVVATVWTWEMCWARYKPALLQMQAGIVGIRLSRGREQSWVTG